MAKYRKKPVVIEAWQYRPTRRHLPSWLSDAICLGDVWIQGGETPYVTIRTLEGEMVARPDDWIICGVKGEIYPCKPDIFAATYEPVD